MSRDPYDLSDREILEMVLNGRTDTFEILIERYSSKVFEIVRKHIPHDQIEEVAHDVFVRTFQSLASFSEKAPFNHWLSRIATRCCYDFWRERYKSREVSLSSITEEHQKWLDDALAARSVEAFEEAASKREATEVLEYALNRLCPEDRMVLTLVYLEGASVQEAADLMGWSVVRVKVRACRSKQRIKKMIARLDGFRKECAASGK